MVTGDVDTLSVKLAVPITGQSSTTCVISRKVKFRVTVEDQESRGMPPTNYILSHKAELD